MFESRKEKTVIAKALKIVGSVTAEGLVEVNGQIDGELHGTSLVISHGAEVAARLQPNAWWWMEKWKARFKAETLFRNPRLMSLAIFNTNRSQ